MKSIQELENVLDEIVGKEDLISLLDHDKQINHYIGFEISGLVHLGTGLMSGIVIRELQQLGISTRVFLADWHTWINNKLGGDREIIKRIAKEYFGPTIKISAQIAGADPTKIELIEGNDLYHENDSYWETVVEVSKNATLSRMLKSTTILGREMSTDMDFAMLIYPAMQAADIFEMKNVIAHAGTDQRNVHMLAREVALKLKNNGLLDAAGAPMKPIALHHPLISGLQKPAQWPLPDNMDKKQMLTSLKMSKSVEGSAIFVQDSPEQIQKVVRKAFCPEKEIGYNPVLNWARHILFPILGEVTIKRDEKYGGTFTVNTYEELEERFESGSLFPLDLKNNVADILIELLEPARKAFSSGHDTENIEMLRNWRKKR